MSRHFVKKTKYNDEYFQEINEFAKRCKSHKDFKNKFGAPFSVLVNSFKNQGITLTAPDFWINNGQKNKYYKRITTDMDCLQVERIRLPEFELSNEQKKEINSCKKIAEIAPERALTVAWGDLIKTPTKAQNVAINGKVIWQIVEVIDLGDPPLGRSALAQKHNDDWYQSSDMEWR